MASDSSEGLVVIGAGLMRTGTNTLQFALQQLLGGKCYHMHEVLSDPPHHIGFWLNAAKNDPSDDEWRSFFRSYRAAVDLPTCSFYKRLMEVYPKAKVVLTVRDPYRWVQSVNSTIGPSHRSLETFPGNVLAYLSNMRHFNTMARLVLEKGFGFDIMAKFEDEELMAEAFRRHVEEVKRYVPPERLLVFEVKDGWDPLCEFLDLPVPPVAFPHVNTAREFNNNVKELKLRQAKRLGTVLLAVAAIGYATYHRAWLTDLLLRR